jgi:lysophospholipase L1-like esterase
VARNSFPWTAIAAGGLVLGVAGVVANVAGRAEATKLQAQKRKVALIGDSYAVGLGPELAKLVPQLRFEGHVGTNSSQWADHSAGCGNCGDWLNAYQPEVTLVALGVNDGNAPNSANFHTIISALHGIGSKVVWIEPPAGVRAPVLRAVIGSLGVQVVPGANVPLAADGIHPSSYKPWARDIARAIS